MVTLPEYATKGDTVGPGYRAAVTDEDAPGQAGEVGAAHHREVLSEARADARQDVVEFSRPRHEVARGGANEVVKGRPLEEVICKLGA